MLSDDSMTFSGGLASISVGTQTYYASPLSRVAHLHFLHIFFIYLYFHLWMLSDDSVIFSSVPASMAIDMQNFSFLRHPAG